MLWLLEEMAPPVAKKGLEMLELLPAVLLSKRLLLMVKSALLPESAIAPPAAPAPYEAALTPVLALFFLKVLLVTLIKPLL